MIAARALVAVLAVSLAGCSIALDPGEFLGAGGMDGAVMRDGGPRPDGGSDAGLPCVCRDAADTCTRDDEGNPRCERPGATCSTCPTGYECRTAGVCECADSVTCGVECASDPECGTTACDPVERVCRPPRGCLNYNACDDVCVDLRCVFGGSVPTGGTCVRAEDCAEGICREGFCRSSCLYNEDCGGGSVCAFVAGSYTPMCMPASGVCATCIDGLSSCSSTGECLLGCEEQFDCDEGEECVLSATGLACRPSALGCGEGEVVIASANACALPLGCYTADSPACLPGFTCMSEEALGLGNARETGFCLRD